MIKFLSLIICIFTALASSGQAQSKPELPAGWSPASAFDYSESDLSSRKQQVPNHVEADFNGDGMTDHAWILTNASKKRYGLFVFLAQNNGHYKMFILDEHNTRNAEIVHGNFSYGSGTISNRLREGILEM